MDCSRTIASFILKTDKVPAPVGCFEMCRLVSHVPAHVGATDLGIEGPCRTLKMRAKSSQPDSKVTSLYFTVICFIQETVLLSSTVQL